MCLSNAYKYYSIWNSFSFNAYTTGVFSIKEVTELAGFELMESKRCMYNILFDVLEGICGQRRQTI